MTSCGKSIVGSQRTVFIALSAIGWGLACLGGSAVGAATFTFTKIADTSTRAPGFDPPLNLYGFSEPALDGDNVVFGAIPNRGGWYGIFLHDGADLRAVAKGGDSGLPGAGEILAFLRPSISGDAVAVSYERSANGGGVLRCENGTCEVIVSSETPAVGFFIYPPSLSGHKVAFYSQPAGVPGPSTRLLVAGPGGVVKVADQDTDLPGVIGKFRGYFDGVDSWPMLVGDDVCFTSATSLDYMGVFLFQGGVFRTIVDNRPPALLPDGYTLNFVENIAFDGTAVLINTSLSGIYIDRGSGLVTEQSVAEPVSGVPSSQWFAFSGAAFSGGHVAFVGVFYDTNTGQFHTGLFSNIDGSYRPLLLDGDTLDGKTLLSTSELHPVTFGIGRQGVRGNDIAFVAYFDDGSGGYTEGVYVAHALTTTTTTTTTSTSTSTTSSTSSTTSTTTTTVPERAPQAKCLVGKNKCMATKANALLKCEQKAESPGRPADPNSDGCVDGAKAKFAGDGDPSKGCFRKLEAKKNNDCITFGDTAPAELLVDDCIGALVAAIDPPPLEQTKCGVGKKQCVAVKLKSLLSCYQKAQTPGKVVEPELSQCLAKAMAKFDGGPDPARGCFAKLEAKRRKDCRPPLGNTMAVETIVDSCASTFMALLQDTMVP